MFLASMVSVNSTASPQISRRWQLQHLPGCSELLSMFNCPLTSAKLMSLLQNHLAVGGGGGGGGISALELYAHERKLKPPLHKKSKSAPAWTAAAEEKRLEWHSKEVRVVSIIGCTVVCAKTMLVLVTGMPANKIRDTVMDRAI